MMSLVFLRRYFYMALWVGSLLMSLGGLVFPMVASAQIVVTSTADDTDPDPSDGVCQSGTTGNPGPCTLRAALQTADAMPGTQTITFNIPGTGPHVIALTYSGQLTAKTPVIIDGFSQPGAQPNTNPVGQGLNTVPMIVVDGGAIGAIWSFEGDGTVIRGLAFLNMGVIIQGADNVAVEGNFLGTDATGTQGSVAAFFNGISIQGGSNVRIGGTDPAQRNLISGKGSAGIQVTSNSSNVVIYGNLIGTDKTGTQALPNAAAGIAVDESFDIFVGGADPAMRNVISGNGGYGVGVSGPGQAVIENNFIGTDVTGRQALGNAYVGVIINSGSPQFGGTRAENVVVRNNVIVATQVPQGSSGGHGIQIYGSALPPTQITIEDNFIGTNALGDKLGNAGDGIRIQDGQDILIQRNKIAYNEQAGVLVRGRKGRTDEPVGIQITENAIFDNGGLGIDLGDSSGVGDGPTDNDPKDWDIGPNNFQNFPVITDVSGNRIDGILHSEPNQTYRIEFFSNTRRDPSGFGEGETFLGSIQVTTDANGDAFFSFTSQATNLTNVTATATQLQTGNTSEFSGQRQFAVNSTADRSDNNPGDGTCDTGQTIQRGNNTEPECTLRAAIEEANAYTGMKYILFDIPTSDPGYSNGIWTVQPASPLPEITEQVTIDGYTQPGANPNTIAASDTSKGYLDTELLIELDGRNVSGSGLVLKNHRESVIRGLVINRFSENGILIEGGGSHRIVGNYIGTNPTGQVTASNHNNGIVIRNSSGNRIGGGTAADRNLISGNGVANRGGGIRVEGGSQGNVIEHNFIGTDVSGTASIYNSRYGVKLTDTGTVDNIVQNNLISGNLDPQFNTTSCAGAGVDISGNAGGNGIYRNYIGTDTDGMKSLPNNEGMCISFAGEANWIQENIISGNRGRGIWIQGQVGAESRATVIDSNQIGVARTTNLFSLILDTLGNGSHGIELGYVPQTEIRNNVIGANKGDGIRGHAQVSGVVIKGNEIVANDGWGIYLKNFRDVTIQGNGISEGKPANTSWRGSGGIIIRPGPPVDPIWRPRISNKKGALKLEGTRGARVGGADYFQDGNNIMEALSGVNAVELVAQADSNRFENNVIEGGNKALTGVYIENSSDNLFRENNIMSFRRNGIAIKETGMGQARRNRITRTTFDGVCGFVDCYAIDLKDDRDIGLSDDGDADVGPNLLQNPPRRPRAYIDWNGDVILLYRVQSNPAHATYPLTIEVFKQFDANSDPTSEFLMELSYPATLASQYTRVVLGKASALGLVAGRRLAMTATDARGNTSEFVRVKIDSVDVQAGLDFGDAPEAPIGEGVFPTGYPTTMQMNGARHAAVFGARLGQLLDAEGDGFASRAADGDDLSTTDDEDGVLFHTPLYSPGPGSSQQVSTQVVPILFPGVSDVTVLNSVGGYVNIWIDFNRDGDWDDSGEHVVYDQFLATPSRLTLNLPAQFQEGLSFMRVRFSTWEGVATTVTGAAPDGEVEDYLVELRRPAEVPFIDFGDAPDSAAASGYPTLLANQRYPAAGHVIGNLLLGDLIDAEWDGQPDSLAQGDGNDEDGVQLPASAILGRWADISVTVSGNEGYLNAWVDFNQDGDWADTLEHVFVDTLLTPGTHQLTFYVPDTAAIGRTYARFRLSSQDSLSFWGIARDGEVEDYVLNITQATAADEEEVPAVFRLEAIYPNPADQRMTVVYTLPEPSSVRLVVYNVLGQEVHVEKYERKARGRVRHMLSTKDWPSGLYLVVLETRAGQRIQRRVVVLH